MSDSEIAVYVSLAAFVISIAGFGVAFSQMKIASAKTKLDLYNKRFSIYVATLEYYLSIWKNDIEDMEEKAREFTKAFRESQFLFDTQDGIYKVLGKIQQNGSTIFEYHKVVQGKAKNFEAGPDAIKALHVASVSATDQFRINLELLEKKLRTYLEFKNVEGWTFL